MPFNKNDPRMQRCACGFEGTIAQVSGHRSRKVYAECLASEPVFLDEPEEEMADTDAGSIDERADGGGPASPAQRQATLAGEGRDTAGRWLPPDATPTAVPPTRTRGIGGRPESGHINGYTPVKAQYSFPAQMHALHDFFVGQGYEGTFQDWITEIVLKCCAEHYRLRFGVYVERPAPDGNGVRHG